MDINRFNFSNVRRAGALAMVALSLANTAFAQTRVTDLKLNPAVATPESVLGFRPGDDNKLNSWASLKEFYEKLAKTSDRVRVQTLGKTTEGRPYLVAIFGAPETIKNLRRYQADNAKISDPRKLKDGDREAEALIKTGKAVVVITCGIHSNEVASYLGGQAIAYRLAAANDDETKRILENTIVVLVPALNPDGVDIVKAQFEESLKADASLTRGTGLPPALYHKYIGHDDNRDWVGFTQAETRISVEKVINPWRPQVLHDIHQQGSGGPRLTLPPYTEPVEPNIPKQLVKGYTDLGFGILKDLTDHGYSGVIAGAEGAAGYDAWSPLRQYAHFHNAVRILQETASARIAAPITVDPSRVRPNKPLPHAPLPWNGGTWRVGDATNYAEAAAFALLNIVATDREKWLRSAYEIAKEAVRPRGVDEVSAWILPDSPNRAALLSILKTGGVEVQTLREPARKDGVEYPAGAALVRLDQPYGGFANAVLSVQNYPNLKDEQGRPLRPYDVTAHTLPLLLDTPAIAIKGSVAELVASQARIRNTPVRLAKRSRGPAARLALLQSNTIDEGWTRWVLEKHGVKYTLVARADLEKPKFLDNFDALLLPTPLGARRRGGAPAGPDAQLPPTDQLIAGDAQGRGPSDSGTTDEVQKFVRDGGTVIALNQASNSLIAALDLPIRDVTSGLSRNDFYVPGSILGAEVDANNPLSIGVDGTASLWVENSPAFEITEVKPGVWVNVVARYLPTIDPLESGWLLGGEKLRGKAALIEARIGKGRAVLFGFEPNYRGIALGTYPLLFNSISSSVRK